MSSYRKSYAQLDCSEHTVMNNIHRGIKKLRRLAEPLPQTNRQAGVDLSVRQLAAISDGSIFDLEGRGCESR
jgi:hypothetical protein